MGAEEENRGLRESKEESCHRTFQLTASHPGFLRAPPTSTPGSALTCILGSFCLQVGSSLCKLRPIRLGLQMATHKLSLPSHLCGLRMCRCLPPSSQDFSPSVHGTPPRALIGVIYVSMHLPLPGNPSLSIQDLP